MAKEPSVHSWARAPRACHPTWPSCPPFAVWSHTPLSEGSLRLPILQMRKVRLGGGWLGKEHPNGDASGLVWPGGQAGEGGLGPKGFLILTRHPPPPRS